MRRDSRERAIGEMWVESGFSFCHRRDERGQQYSSDTIAMRVPDWRERTESPAQAKLERGTHFLVGQECPIPHTTLDLTLGLHFLVIVPLCSAPFATTPSFLCLFQQFISTSVDRLSLARHVV